MIYDEVAKALRSSWMPRASPSRSAASPLDRRRGPISALRGVGVKLCVRGSSPARVTTNCAIRSCRSTRIPAAELMAAAATIRCRQRPAHHLRICHAEGRERQPCRRPRPGPLGQGHPANFNLIPFQSVAGRPYECSRRGHGPFARSSTLRLSCAIRTARPRHHGGLRPAPLGNPARAAQPPQGPPRRRRRGRPRDSRLRLSKKKGRPLRTPEGAGGRRENQRPAVCGSSPRRMTTRVFSPAIPKSSSLIVKSEPSESGQALQLVVTRD